MTIINWDPFQTLSNLQSDAFVPLTNIYEDKDGYHFEVDAPGMSREQFAVSVEDNVLTVTGERKIEEQAREKQYHRVEREYGSFTRSFWLPETADTAKVDAAYRNGVLTISIAKKEAAKPRQIEVKVAA